MPTNVFVLNPSSGLKSFLSIKQPLVTLNSDITCNGDECNVDTLRLVQIQENPPLYYEYIRPKCVELSFYDNGKKISTKRSGAGVRKSMCANQDIDAAYDTCCEKPLQNRPVASFLCYYDLERTTYATSKSRCNSIYPDGDMCDPHFIKDGGQCSTGAFLPVSIHSSTAFHLET